MSAQRQTLTVMPLHFTSEYRRWREFYLSLGLRSTEADHPMATVLAAGSGQLMLAEVEPGDALDGLQLVEFTVSDLQAHADALQAAGVSCQQVQLPHRNGPSLAVDLPQGRVHIGPAMTSAGAADFDPAVLNIGALLYCPAETVQPGAEALAQYGLTPRIASDNGGWTDLVGHGVFAFHEGALRTVDHEAPGQPVVQVFGEAGDAAELCRQLDARGVEATVIDEAYGRSLRIMQPDGTQLQFNETMQDLYGYQRLSSASAD